MGPASCNARPRSRTSRAADASLGETGLCAASYRPSIDSKPSSRPCSWQRHDAGLGGGKPQACWLSHVAIAAASSTRCAPPRSLLQLLTSAHSCSSRCCRRCISERRGCVWTRNVTRPAKRPPQPSAAPARSAAILLSSSCSRQDAQPFGPHDELSTGDVVPTGGTSPLPAACIMSYTGSRASALMAACCFARGSRTTVVTISRHTSASSCRGVATESDLYSSLPPRTTSNRNLMQPFQQLTCKEINSAAMPAANCAMLVSCERARIV